MFSNYNIRIPELFYPNRLGCFGTKPKVKLAMPLRNAAKKRTTFWTQSHAVIASCGELSLLGLIHTLPFCTPFWCCLVPVILRCIGGIGLFPTAFRVSFYSRQCYNPHRCVKIWRVPSYSIQPPLCNHIGVFLVCVFRFLVVGCVHLYWAPLLNTPSCHLWARLCPVSSCPTRSYRYVYWETSLRMHIYAPELRHHRWTAEIG